MPKHTCLVTIDKDLEILIPEYLKNRRQEIEVLRKALASTDFEELRQRGHRMKGVGTSYGFDLVTALGSKIEHAAKSGDGNEIGHLIEQYSDYLGRLTIVYE